MTLSNIALQTVAGYGDGHTYVTFYRKREEISKGANYVFSSLVQIAEFQILAGLLYKIATQTLSKTTGDWVGLRLNLAALLAVPLFPLASAVKQNLYPSLATPGWLKLPETVVHQTTAVCNFIAEQGSRLMFVAVIASLVALAALGNTAYVASFSVSLIYDVVHKAGFIPPALALFVEKYAMLGGSVAALLTGTWIFKVYTVGMLASYNPELSKQIFYGMDATCRKLFQMNGPSLRESEAPLVQRRNLSYNTIRRVLNMQESDFTLDYAHCSHSVSEVSEMGSLPEDRNFDKIATLFDSVNWVEKYPLVKRACLTDDKFIEQHTKKIPKEVMARLQATVRQEPGEDSEVFRARYRKAFADLIERYFTDDPSADEKAKAAYLAAWMKGNIGSLVAVLTRRKIGEGSEANLEDAMRSASRIIPYLEKVGQGVEFEDGLLLLAIEAGEYCNRGIKRATADLEERVALSGLASSDENTALLPKRELYELKIRQALQNARKLLVEKTYQSLAEAGHIPNVIARDVHGMDLYRSYIARGFIPLTRNEIESAEVIDLMVWEYWQHFRLPMYKDYASDLMNVFPHEVTHVATDARGRARHFTRMESGESGTSRLEFATYLQEVIDRNPNLSETQKEAILELYIDSGGAQRWTVEETHRRFGRLVLLMMGVLKCPVVP